MALVSAALENDIASAFKSMGDGDNKVFSQKISAAVKKFSESGTVTTVDAGAISAGAFTGAGTGGIEVDDSICEEIIYAACTAMDSMGSGGNAFLAEQLAIGIHSMVSAGNVETDVNGTAITASSPPVTIPVSGKATGSMAGVPAPMQAAFTAAFNSMDNMTEGGDDYLAQQMATAIDAYHKASAINTNGSAALAGSIGTGAME